MRRLFLLLVLAMASLVAPFAYGSMTGADNISGSAGSYSSRQSSGVAADPGTGSADASCSGACATLMDTAVGRWKMSDAQCSGVDGDCSDGETIETVNGWNTDDAFVNADGTDRPTWDADCGGSESFGCADFDGVNDYLSAGNILSDTWSGVDADFSFLIVFRNNAPENNMGIFGKMGVSTLNEFSIETDDTGGEYVEAVFYHANDVSKYKAFEPSYRNRTDLHGLVITNDGSVDAITRWGVESDRYDDDPTTTSQSGSTYGDIVASTAELCIAGRESDCKDGYLNGLVVEIAVFPSVLTAGEITTINTYLKDTYSIVRPPPGYVADWRADQAACSGTQGDCADAETAETLHNIGSEGTSFANASGTDVPTYVASCVNGQPCINFDGTDDYYDAGDILDSEAFVGTDSDFAVVMVAKTETTQQQYVFSKVDAGGAVFEMHAGDTANCPTTSNTNGFGQILYFSGNSVNYRAVCGNYMSGNSDFHSHLWNYDGSLDTNDGLDRFAYENDRHTDVGVIEFSNGALADTGANTASLLMGNYYTLTFPYDGKIAETMVYPAPLTAAQITGLNEYLQVRYDIVRPPPGYAVWLDGQDLAGDGTYNSGVSDEDTAVTVVGKGLSGNTFAVAGDPKIDKTCEEFASGTFTCVDFDGVADDFIGDQSAMNYSSSWVCGVATLSPTSIGGKYRLFETENAATNTGARLIHDGADYELYHGATQSVTQAATLGNLFMFTVEGDATAQLRINGSDTGLSGDVTGRDLDRVIFGTDVLDTNYAQSVVEFLAYGSTQTLADCETYFVERYGADFWD